MLLVIMLTIKFSDVNFKIIGEHVFYNVKFAKNLIP